MSEKQDPDCPKQAADIHQLKKFQHEVRTPLQVLSGLVDMAGMTSDVPVEMVKRGRASIRRIVDMVKNILDHPVELHTMEDARFMMEETLKETVTMNPQLKEIAVVLESIPEDLKDVCLPISKYLCSTVSNILLPNALRANARNVAVSFSRSYLRESQAVQIMVKDDGDGMTKDILDGVREGRQITSKSLEDGLNEGETIEDHGIGLCTLRDLIERCKGEMQVDSVHKDADPDNHHTTFTFVLPSIVKHVPKIEVVADASATKTAKLPQPAALAGGDVHMSRRTMLALLGGTAATAATAGGVFVYRSGTQQEHSDVPDGTARTPHSPVSGIETEGNAIRSFAVDVGGTKITYEHGGKNEGFLHVKNVETDNGSVVVFQPAPAEKIALRTMFLANTPEGVFGQADVSHAGGRDYGYVCSPRRRKPDESPSDLYLQQDTVFSDTMFLHGIPFSRGHFQTSASLIESPDLQFMHVSLERMFDELADPEHTDAVRARLVIGRLLSVYEAYAKNHARATTIDEWKNLLKGSGQFIVADRQVAQELGRKPLTPKEAEAIRRTQAGVCLVGIPVAQAQSILPT